jgi:O-succinylbenzoic acid--CoA ligase
MPIQPQPTTLGAQLRRAARVAGAEPALVGDFGSLSWAELARRAQALAQGLQAFAAGDQRPHAVSLKPDRDDVVVLLAHALAGIPLLPLHPALPDADALRLAQAAGARRVPLAQCLDLATAAPLRNARLAQVDDDLFLVPTSGSSGLPKLARLTHRAVLAAAAALTERLPFGKQDRWILTLPLSHVGGLSVVTRCVAALRPIVLVPRFGEDAVLQAIQRDQGTRLSAVPAIAHRLLAADAAGVLRRLSLVMLGGQAAPLALRQALADAGVPAVASYGLTESCAAAACEAPTDAGRLLPGCGTALPGMAIQIRAPGGLALPTGSAGSIYLQGASLLAGYAGRTDLAAFDAHGWLDTGDLGWLDDTGRLHVQGRRSEVIVTGGEKVVPGVVEAALREHPAVRDAVVFAQPDERWGAIVCAAVEAHESALALHGEPSLPALLATLLPPWARPRRLACLPALPRLNTGKVDRRGTPALAAAHLKDWPPR